MRQPLVDELHQLLRPPPTRVELEESGPLDGGHRGFLVEEGNEVPVRATGERLGLEQLAQRCGRQRRVAGEELIHSAAHVEELRPAAGGPRLCEHRDVVFEGRPAALEVGHARSVHRRRHEEAGCQLVRVPDLHSRERRLEGRVLVGGPRLSRRRLLVEGAVVKKDGQLPRQLLPRVVPICHRRRHRMPHCIAELDECRALRVGVLGALPAVADGEDAQRLPREVAASLQRLDLLARVEGLGVARLQLLPPRQCECPPLRDRARRLHLFRARDEPRALEQADWRQDEPVAHVQLLPDRLGRLVHVLELPKRGRARDARAGGGAAAGAAAPGTHELVEVDDATPVCIEPLEQRHRLLPARRPAVPAGPSHHVDKVLERNRATQVGIELREGRAELRGVRRHGARRRAVALTRAHDQRAAARTRRG
mmetsp:Transcript_4790/g.14307  ORF Transcript_4790/g.14307 Transcript_4790/m.14307 type:complete len:424 (-) Transcript_4790:37-1308(-)